jgi:hypothetical protein
MIFIIFIGYRKNIEKDWKRKKNREIHLFYHISINEMVVSNLRQYHYTLNDRSHNHIFYVLFLLFIPSISILWSKRSWLSSRVWSRCLISFRHPNYNLRFICPSNSRPYYLTYIFYVVGGNEKLIIFLNEWNRKERNL